MQVLLQHLGSVIAPGAGPDRLAAWPLRQKGREHLGKLLDFFFTFFVPGVPAFTFRAFTKRAPGVSLAQGCPWSRFNGCAASAGLL